LARKESAHVELSDDAGAAVPCDEHLDAAAVLLDKTEAHDTHIQSEQERQRLILEERLADEVVAQ
jgi:hypothetical protein